MRLNKRISSSGFCSRRAADEYIKSARVSVNGVVTVELGTRVTDKDEISIDGIEISRSTEIRLWLYYKPVGLITTHKDENGRPTVFDNLPTWMPRVVSIGRLDINSEGLLLLTNSGDLARKLELPANNFLRIYHVRAFGSLTQDKVVALKNGIVIDGFKYGSVQVEHVRGEGKNRWYEVKLKEGKNREIRKLFEFCGLQVNKLIRVAYGPYQLLNMKPGEVIEVEE